MFTESAALYDEIYHEFKDYGAESRSLNEIIVSELDSARTILDVACGTGEHAKILGVQYGYNVDGIDVDEGLVSIAKQKYPEGDFYCADMVDFNLEKTYDVVMCLFSSIGYVKTLERVTRVFKRFKAHTNNGGLILVEPWLSPDALTPGKISLNTAQTEAFSVARMGYCEIDGNISTIHFEYLIGSSAGIEYRTEEHELGLFTVDEMKQCFDEVGLNAAFDEEGISGRGLFIVRK